MTLEQLYFGNTEAYWPARAAKVSSLASYLLDHIKPELSAEGIAEHLMDLAECNGRICGDDVDGEVPSSHTINGNPLPFTV